MRPTYLLSKIGSWLGTLLTAALALLWLTPIAWALVASFRPETEPMTRGDVWFGSTFTVENYTHAWSLAPFGRYYLNTIALVLLILSVQLVTVILGGFALAHYQFPGKKAIFFFILLQMMIPTSALRA